MRQQRTIHDDVQAALKRLDSEDPGLKQMLKKAYGYAVFPSVGKAALVIGGAYGRGEVYERGKVIGYATIAQTTIGVQIGGDTFTEVLVFENTESLDRFKRGKTAFAANASAVLVKAAAAGTADYEKGVAAYAYSQGGMLLEAAIGGQRFHFQEAEQQQDEEEDDSGAADRRGGSKARGGSKGQAEEEEGGDEDEQGQGVLGSAADGLKSAASKTTELVKEHPVAATLIGTGVLAGVGLLIMRAMRKSGSMSQQAEDGDEGASAQEEDESSPEAEYDDQAEDQSEQEDESDEQDQDDSEDDDDGGVDEVDEAPRHSRVRARS